MIHLHDEDKEYLKTIEEKYNNKIYFLGPLEECFYDDYGLIMVDEDKYDFMIEMHQYYNLAFEECSTIRDKFNPLQKFENLKELQNYLDKHYKEKKNER